MPEQALPQKTSPFDEQDTELTSPSQPDHTVAPSTSDQEFHPHPSTFSFPTLNLDGSLPDLASSPTYSPTPPAALSSLGARLKMAEHDTLSEASLDSQYDMVDDVSELSTDDHETASLMSTERDDQLTPEDSVVDLQEAQDEEDNATSHMLQSEGEVRAENELLDSYMETPRQSMVRGTILERREDLTYLSSSSKISQPTKDEGTYRVLFCSEKTVMEDVMSSICRRIAVCLAPAGEKTKASTSKLVRLPPTPSGDTTSPTYLLRLGDVELLVELCVFHETTPDPSIITHRLETPELAVFYLDTSGYPCWFNSIKENLRDRQPPSLMIAGPDFAFDKLNEDEREWIYESDVVLTYDQYFLGDEAELRRNLQLLVAKKTSVVEPKLRPAVSLKERIRELAKQHNIGCSPWGMLMPGLMVFVIILAVLIKPYLELLDGYNPSPATAIAEVQMRRLELATAFNTTLDKTLPVYDIDHLVPYPALSSTSMGKQQLARVVPETTRSHYLYFRDSSTESQHIIVSLPRKEKNPRHFLQVTSANMTRLPSDTLSFNITKMIDGVYDFSLDLSDVYGEILTLLHTDTVDPIVAWNLTLDFGNKYFKRRTYENVGSELSKVINKDVAVARKNVKTLGDRVGLELGAAGAATRNITTELAVYITRDLQVLANTAVSVFSKAAVASNETAASIRKELIVLRKDLVKLSKDVQKYIKSTTHSTKAMVPTFKTLKSPLKLSKERAARFRDKVLGDRKKETNSTSSSVTKELSLRLQNLFHPNEKTKKAGKWRDIAKCAGKDDYKGCRKEQKALAAITTTKSAAKAVSTAKMDDEKRVKDAVREVKADGKAWKKGRCKRAKMGKVDAKRVKKEEKKARKGKKRGGAVLR